MVVGDLSTGTEVLIIGGGPGGYVAAIRASQLGKEVTLVEKEQLGGVCLHKGCIPSKAIIHAADLFYKIKHADVIGITAENVSIDIKKMQEWKENILSTLTNGINTLCKKNKIKVLKGNAFFESSTMVKVLLEDGFKNIEFENAIISTGSVPIELPNFKFDGKIIINSEDAIKLKSFPKNLVVIGGGYIGLELAVVYSKLGSNVSVVEYAEQILPSFDKDIVSVLAKNLQKLGIKIYLQSKAEKCEIKGDSAMVTISLKDGENVTLQADVVLVAVGRKPNTSELKLENTRIQLDENGFIRVDNQLRTTEKKIFAIGDLANQPMLAHKATRQGKVAAEVIGGKESSFDNIVVPSVVFTEPEIAIAGITENEAGAKGYDVKVGRFPFSALGRALTVNDTNGFVKIIADKNSEIVLGVSVIGYNASDIISEAALAIEMGATLEDIELTIHPHPSFSESLMESAEVAKGKAIHIFGG